MKGFCCSHFQSEEVFDADGLIHLLKSTPFIIYVVSGSDYYNALIELSLYMADTCISITFICIHVKCMRRPSQLLCPILQVIEIALLVGLLFLKFYFKVESVVVLLLICNIIGVI